MKTEYKIEGMMCMHCVAAVEKAIKAVDGVSSVEVSLENKCAVVDGGDADAVKKAVEGEGFKVI